MGALAFVGAALGSVLTFAAARRPTGAESRARRQEEWGRRFTAGLQAVASPEPDVAALGHAIFVGLMEADLASDEDRRLARAVLEASSTYGAHADLTNLIGRSSENIEIVPDWQTADEEDGAL